MGCLGLASGALATDFGQWMAAGQNAYVRGDYTAASDDYQAAARLSPSAQAYDGEALSQFRLGRTAPSRAALELALARDPRAPDIQALAVLLGAPKDLGRGLQDLQAASPRSAVEPLQRAALQAPDWGLVWRSLALAFLGEGRLQESLASLDKAGQVEGSSPDLGPLRLEVETAFEAFLWKVDQAGYWQRRGVYLFRVGLPAQAVRAFEGAARLKPGDAAIWVNLGMARWKLKDWAGMDQALKRAQALDPANAGARYLLAVYLAHTGQASQAAAQLQSLATTPSGAYAGLAQADLAQWNAASTTRPWGVFARALVGPAQGQSEVVNNLPVSTSRTVASQDYLRLNAEAFSSTKLPTDLAYSLYLTPFKLYGRDWNLGTTYESAELDQHYKPWARLDTQLGYVGSVMDSSALDLVYDSDDAKAQADLKLDGNFTLSALGQALWERYPDAALYDALSELESLTTIWVSARGDVVSFGLGGRQDTARSSAWTYHNLDATLYGRLMLFKGWSLAVTGLWQPQVYPDDPVRYDRILAATLELDVPLFPHTSFVLGDQYNRTLSTVALDATQYDFAYAGLQFGL